MSEQVNNIDSTTLNDRVFIDSNAKVLRKAKELQSSIPQRNKSREKRPVIRPAFPPKIKPEDLILRPENGGKPPRSPNSFIIYRKIFVETARADGYHLPMTTVSSMASQSWEEESEEVKSYYKKLAKEAYNCRSEMYPKLERRRKRKRWNIVSFEPSNDKSSSEYNSNTRLSPTIPKSPDNNQVSNQYFNDSSRLPPETENIDGISLTQNGFYDHYAFDYQNTYNTYPSSEFPTISSDSSPELSTHSSDSFDYSLDLSSPLPVQNTLQFDSKMPNTEDLNSNIIWDQPLWQDYVINANNIMTTIDSLGISQFPLEVVADNNQFSNLLNLQGNLNYLSPTFNEMYCEDLI